MAYKFTIKNNYDGHKMFWIRGKQIRWIMVKETTSPKKFLKYLEELKKAGHVPYLIYETDLLASLMNSSTSCPDAIMRLKINESCLANDGHDLYKVTRISRHLCHCECLPYAW